MLEELEGGEQQVAEEAEDGQDEDVIRDGHGHENVGTHSDLAQGKAQGEVSHGVHRHHKEFPVYQIGTEGLEIEQIGAQKPHDIDSCEVTQTCHC